MSELQQEAEAEGKVLGYEQTGRDEVGEGGPHGGARCRVVLAPACPCGNGKSDVGNVQR